MDDLIKVENRHKLLNEMIEETFEFADIAKEFDNDNDLAAAKVTLDYLIAAERLVCAEEIFLDTFYHLGDMRYPDRDEKEHLLTIFLVDGVHVFAREVLLRNLEYTLKVLSEWGLKTEEGEEFKKFICERLAALIDKYNFIYDV